MNSLNQYVCNLSENLQKDVVIKLVNYYYTGVNKDQYPCVMEWMEECWKKKLEDVAKYIK